MQIPRRASHTALSQTQFQIVNEDYKASSIFQHIEVSASSSLHGGVYLGVLQKQSVGQKQVGLGFLHVQKADPLWRRKMATDDCG